MNTIKHQETEAQVIALGQQLPGIDSFVVIALGQQLPGIDLFVKIMHEFTYKLLYTIIRIHIVYIIYLYLYILKCRVCMHAVYR